MNGLVYHANHADGYDLALKVSKRDERDRAGRENASTLALHESGRDMCAHPLHLERDSANFPGDVIISEWLPGQALDKPPAPENRAAWLAILESMSRAHSLTPKTSPAPLRNAVMDVREPIDLLNYITGWLEKLPQGEIGALHHDQLERLNEHVRSVTPPHWTQPAPIGLIQCDANPNNMLLYNGKIVLVDWENSGWSDPAFDLADLLTKPNFGEPIPENDRDWIRAEHGRLLHDPLLPERCALYERLLIVWWTLRTSGYLTEDRDQRLAGVHRVNRERTMAQQLVMWQQSCALYGLDP
jgi:thiamine kinase-like enzyme